MTQTSTLRGPQTAAGSSTHTTSGFSYPQQFERLERIVPYAEALVISGVPRGGLQVTQAANGNESLFRSYSRGLQTEDRATWQAIVTGQALTGPDAWGRQAFEDSRYRQEVMAPAGFAHVAAAPIKNVVLPGYDGALHVYRTADQGPFSPSDLQKLAMAAKEIETSLSREHQARAHHHHEAIPKWAHRPASRQFVFDHEINELLGDRLSQLDDRLRHQMIQHARHQLQLLDGQAFHADRLQLPDSQSDLWTLRVTVYKNYPALAEGPVIFFCLQPECGEWALVRPGDFQADVELARMVPAMKYMRDEFQRGPTLNEIANPAHLSPYHFHRRFTDLLGLTPKHFMLECQIQEAKKQLAAGVAGLAEISKACGFSHQSHFTSRFKQAAGLTPTRWRRIVANGRS